MDAVWQLISEIVKALGGDRLQQFIEPICKRMFGETLGHDAAVVLPALVILATTSLFGMLVSQQLIRLLRAIPIVAGARLRRRRQFRIAIADFNGDRFGGRKKAFISEVQRAVRTAVSEVDAPPEFALELLSIPVRFELPDLEQLGRINRALAKVERSTRRWLNWTDADVMIWGEYVPGDKDEPGGLSVAYIPRASDSLYARPYEMRGIRISDSAAVDVRDNFIDALVASVASQITVLLPVREHDEVIGGLGLIIERIQRLLDARTYGIAERDRAELRVALGDAALAIGRFHSNDKWLRRAIAAYQEASESQTEAADPQRWFLNQIQIGEALGLIGERFHNDEALVEAVNLLVSMKDREAWEEESPLALKLFYDLGMFSETLGERLDSVDHLRLAAESLGICRQYLALFRPNDATSIAAVEVKRGEALLSLSDYEQDDPSIVRGAVKAFADAATSAIRSKRPLLEALTAHFMGRACRRLADIEQQPQAREVALASGVQSFTHALTPAFRRNYPPFWILSAQLMSDCLIRLAMSVAPRDGLRAERLLKQAEELLADLMNSNGDPASREFAILQSNLAFVIMWRGLNGKKLSHLRHADVLFTAASRTLGLLGGDQARQAWITEQSDQLAKYAEELEKTGSISRVLGEKPNDIDNAQSRMST